MTTIEAEAEKVVAEVTAAAIEQASSIKTTADVPEQEEIPKKKKKAKSSDESFFQFIYDARRKTVLGRDSLNWAKLAGFYSVFFFCLGCFFVIFLNIFALFLDREVPTYYNTDSTMAVRSTATVVGMGFRPQPAIDDNLIRVSPDDYEQKRIATSLRIFRDVYLLQRSDARTEPCNEKDPASELPQGVACAFNWFDIVSSQSHPCSDNNYYGFKNQEPCVLVKLNKETKCHVVFRCIQVFGWKPIKGPLPMHIQELRGISSNKSVADSDVYITCDGTNPADRDALTGKIIYYSLDNPMGSAKYGAIPNYYFPYRNARDHVQPFVLAQFKDLPNDQLISVTCRAWAPGMEHDTRAMRGMVNFQLYRTGSKNPTNDESIV